MKYLVDVQLPEALARWLRERGFDAVHALDRELGQASDSELWALAAAEGRVMVSKDEDFFILALRRGDEGRLLWIRLGNCRTKQLIERMAQDWDRVAAAFAEGQQIVEVR